MSSINKNTGQLRSTASQLNGYRDRISHLGSDLDAALRPARRGDVPELGQIEGTYGPLRSRISNSATTMDIQAQNLRQYADRSDQIEQLLTTYTASLGLLFGAKAGSRSRSGSLAHFGSSVLSDVKVGQSHEHSPKEHWRGKGPQELSPYVERKITYGHDWQMFGDSANLFHRSDKVGWVPRETSITAGYEGVTFLSANAGRVAGGYRADAKIGARAGVSLKSTQALGNKKVNVSTSSEVSAQIEASAKATGEISKKQVRVHVGAEAGAEAKAEVGAGGKVSGVTGHAGAYVSAGAGVHAHAGGELSRKKIGVELDVGASLGIGGGYSYDVSVDPEEVYGDAKHITVGAVHVVQKIDLPDVPRIKKSDLDPRHWGW